MTQRAKDELQDAAGMVVLVVILLTFLHALARLK